jgi:Fur family zinc uptake transcriptional regulator
MDHGHETAQGTAQDAARGTAEDARGAWLRRVEALCGERNVQLTALRRQVLGLLADSAAPLTAYALIDGLAKLQERQVAPPTVYRTLDFLVENGFVIKIESRNAFAVCDSPGHHHHGILLICTRCGVTEEVDDHDVDATLARRAEASGFRIEKQMVELEGTCGRCLPI